MTDQKPDPKPTVPPDVLADLHAASNGFLARLNAIRGTPSPAAPAEEGFEAVFARVKNIVGGGAAAETPPAPGPVAPSVTPPAPSASPPPTAHETVGEIVAKLADLKSQMKNQPPETIPPDWDGLDALVRDVRSSWVQVLSQGSTPPPQAAFWLGRWVDIIEDIRVLSDSWPAPHASTWATWADQRATEAKSLASWVANAAPTNVALSVPAHQRGQGIVPLAPQGMPSERVSDLQECADYWSWASAQPAPLAWSGTAAQAALSECAERLAQWSASTADQARWKEDALDRYAVLDGHLTLKAAAAPPTPNRARPR